MGLDISDFPKHIQAQIRGKLGISEQPKKKSKYRNSRQWVDGLLFDSSKESNYHILLDAQLKAGEIRGYCRQARFLLTKGFGKEERAEEYLADFIVFHNDGSSEIIDVKGFKTQLFTSKHKHFKEKYPELEIILK